MYANTARDRSKSWVKRHNCQQFFLAALLLASSCGLVNPAFASVLPSLVPRLGATSSQPADDGPSALSSAELVETHFSQTPIPTDRQGEGTVPIPQIRLSSSDTLSDTKIFVLLAAIVFIFLIALGVAMARVSRNRNRHQDERIRQQIVAAQRPPETLNKTILDLLPVYEVTEKRQLRLLHSSQSPDLPLNECFLDNCGEYGSTHRPGELACNSEGSMVKMRTNDMDALVGGYDLESVSSIPYEACSTNCAATESALDSGADRVGCNKAGDVELMEWQPDRRFAEMPGDWPGMQRKRRSPSSIEPPMPAAAASSRFPLSRFKKTSASQSISPSASASTRHSSAGYLHDEALSAGSSRKVLINAGAALYHERSSRSRSLDLSPGREISFESSGAREPEPAWLVHSSQPAIARCQSRCSMAASDSGAGLGACPICLEEFDIGEHVRELPCKHKYHVICIDTWLVSRSTCCPYCKLDIRRWYYGPSLEDGLTRRGSLVNTSGQQVDFGESSLLANLQDTTDEQHARRRRLERIRARRSRARRRDARPSNYNYNASRWERMWLALRATSGTGVGHVHI